MWFLNLKLGGIQEGRERVHQKSNFINKEVANKIMTRGREGIKTHQNFEHHLWMSP